MTKIYIARHGQNEDNANGILNGHRDLPLTELGIKQAHQLATHIKDSGLIFDEIYSSPLQRAHKTAEIVAETLGMPEPKKFDLIIERDFGSMTGKLIADIEALCGPDIIKTDVITYFLTSDKAETFPDLIQRGQKVIDYIKGNYHEKSILLVCHGDIGKMIYGAFYQENWEDMLRNFHFGNCELLLLDEHAAPDARHVLKIDQFNH